MIPRFAKQLIISDSTYRKINHQDISQQTAKHSYSSATIKDTADTADKCMKKLKPHRVVVCKISPVKDGCYGRNSNNEAITKFNEQLEMICLELDGLYPWSKVECLDNAVTDNGISYDGVHPNINGIKNLVNNIRH